MKEQCEITIWCEGQTDGRVFKNQSVEKANQVVECIGLGKAFGLFVDEKTFMVFGRDKVINAQFKSVYGEGKGL
jgi:hypothetical protein